MGIPTITLVPSTGKALQYEPGLAPKHEGRKFSLSNKTTYPHSTKKLTVATQEIATAAKEVAGKATETVHHILSNKVEAPTTRPLFLFPPAGDQRYPSC